MTPSRSFARRLRDTFVAPRRLCASLRAAPVWVDALLLATAIAVVAWALQPGEVFLEQMRNPVTRLGEPVQITSPAADVVRYGRFNAMLSALVGHPMLAFGLAGVLTVVFSDRGRWGESFRRHLAVTSHALLIPAAGTLLALAATALGVGPAPLASALGLSTASGSLALRSLAWLDPFALWMMLVLAVGVEQVDARRSWGRAATLLVLGYLASTVAWAAVV